MKRIIISILILLLALGSVVVSAVLREPLGEIGFWIILIFGVVLLIGGAFELFYTLHRRSRRRRARPRGMPDRERAQESVDDDSPEYRKKGALLSVPEQSFYTLLKKLLPCQIFDIYPQMALVSVIDKITHTSYRNELFRIADFCIVDVQTTEPLLLIELNDASHLRKDVIERDKKVNALCAKARMPIVAFTLAEAADERYVDHVLRAHL